MSVSTTVLLLTESQLEVVVDRSVGVVVTKFEPKIFSLSAFTRQHYGPPVPGIDLNCTA